MLRERFVDGFAELRKLRCHAFEVGVGQTGSPDRATKAAQFFEFGDQRHVDSPQMSARGTSPARSRNRANTLVYMYFSTWNRPVEGATWIGILWSHFVERRKPREAGVTTRQ